jgi:MYXO-CTERM domain-containing protein
MCPRDGNACYLLGKAHRDGKGVTRGNASMAFRFFDNGCKARSADACQQLASAYKSGRGTLKDIKKGNEVLERTCNELDSPQSCTDVGLAMTKLPKSARQPERIKAVAERACALEKKSCWLKGYIYDQGFAGRTDQRVATQYYEMSCTDGYGEACRAVGFRYKNGTGVPKNRKKAMVFWKRGCEIGNGQSCLVLARKMEIGGTYGTRNPRMAVYYAIGACQKKVKEGCQMAGARIRDNKHGVANVKPAQSRSLFFEGCRLGHSISCNALAKLHLEGKLIPRNPRKAVQNFEKACDLNHSSACQTLAELYSSGREAGIAKNPIQAARAYARACYAGYGSACFKIDTIVKEQKPDRIVRDQLRRKLERACRKPVMKACEALGLAYVQGGGLAKKDERGAFDMFKKSCERNKKSNGWACNSLGQMYANGVGTRKDVEVAKGLFREQCDLRNQFGCYQLAVQLFYQKSYGEAMGLFKQTCEDKHADSCNFVGYMMFHGKGTQWDAAGAIPFYEKACELGEAVGCSNVAELHFWGIGRAVDYEKAYELYKQTCDKSGNYGCTYVGRFHQKGLGVVPVDLDLADQAYAKVCAEPLDWTKAQACLWQAEVARERGQKSETEIARMRTRARGLVEERAKEDGGYGKYLLGLVYRDGVATVANPKRAAELFGESCEDNSVMGCFTAGEFYLAGAKGLEPDRRKAESYFERACAAGMSRACEGAKEARKPPPVAKQPEVPLKPADRNPGCACDSAGLPTQSGLWALLVGIGLLFSRRREKRRARARASRR